ncbi:hypothetical protein JB92DRAFT_2837272 [Gautieria morchelliformis]|nr:hypothetical protein JB92DRAFT_2837272 [Gautieria morchelliformis]
MMGKPHATLPPAPAHTAPNASHAHNIGRATREMGDTRMRSGSVPSGAARTTGIYAYVAINPHRIFQRPRPRPRTPNGSHACGQARRRGGYMGAEGGVPLALRSSTRKTHGGSRRDGSACEGGVYVTSPGCAMRPEPPCGAAESPGTNAGEKGRALASDMMFMADIIVMYAQGTAVPPRRDAVFSKAHAPTSGKANTGWRLVVGNKDEKYTCGAYHDGGRVGESLGRVRPAVAPFCGIGACPLWAASIPLIGCQLMGIMAFSKDPRTESESETCHAHAFVLRASSIGKTGNLNVVKAKDPANREQNARQHGVTHINCGAETNRAIRYEMRWRVSHLDSN